MSTFLDTLNRLIADPALATKNTVFDAGLQALFQAKIANLTPDVTTWWGAPDVLTSGDVPTGSLGPNVLKNRIEIDVDGFDMRFSKFRDGLQSTPRKIRRRKPSDILSATPSDRVRYVLADPTDGVLLLDQNLEIVRTFPGLIASGTITGAQYRQAECAAVGTVAATEIVAIACGSQHAVQIFNYTTGALIATIGTPGTAGIPTGLPVRLTDPVSVAIDETNSRLWIACRTGDAGVDTTDAGFVSEFDITVPSAPVFVAHVVMGAGFYRLNNKECRRPSDVFFQPARISPVQEARLWIANGLGDVAGFTRALVTDSWVPTLVLEAQGQGYTLGPDTIPTVSNLYAENAIDLLKSADTNTRLYVAASRTAQIEVFRISSAADLVFGQHETTYGYRGIETTTPYESLLRVYSTPQQPKLTFGVFSSATGVVADETILPGETTATSILVGADADAGRVQRLRLPVYSNINTVTFTASTSGVPIIPGGWFLPADADLPASYVTVEIRDPGAAATLTTPAIPATPWREVPPAGISVPITGPALTRYQLRLRVQIPTTAPVKAYQVPALGVLLRQQW